MSIGCSASASTRPIGSLELCPSAIACSSSSRFCWPVMVIAPSAPTGSRRGSASPGDRHVGGHRVRRHADRAAGLGRIERVLHVGAGEDRRGVAVAAHAEPDQVRRPRQVLQPRVGGIAGELGVLMSAAIGTTRAPSGRKVLAMPRMLLRSSSIGTSRSSVGMMVSFFHGSDCLASFGKIAGPVEPPGTAISEEPRASIALSMMNPTSPATASASSSSGMIFPPFNFDHANPSSCYRGAGCAYPNHPATACPLRLTAGRNRSRSWTMLQRPLSIAGFPVPRSTVHSLTRLAHRPASA